MPMTHPLPFSIPPGGYVVSEGDPAASVEFPFAATHQIAPSTVTGGMHAGHPLKLNKAVGGVFIGFTKAGRPRARHKARRGRRPEPGRLSRPAVTFGPARFRRPAVSMRSWILP